MSGNHFGSFEALQSALGEVTRHTEWIGDILSKAGFFPAPDDSDFWVNDAETVISLQEIVDASDVEIEAIIASRSRS